MFLNQNVFPTKACETEEYSCQPPNIFLNFMYQQ